MKAEVQQLRRRLLFRYCSVGLLGLVLGLLVPYSFGLPWYLGVALGLAVLGGLAWLGRFLRDRTILQVVETVRTLADQAKREGASKQPVPSPQEAVGKLAADLRSYAEEVEHSRGTFRTVFADVSHQMSQPLTALRGLMELALQKRCRVAEYRATLEEAMEQADRMVWLARSLRELADSVDPGGVKETVWLETVVKEVTDDLRPLAEARGLSLAFECEGDLCVSANSVRLQQAILNLVGRAINHSPKAGRVRVSLSNSNGEACLSIFDQGPGIPPAELEYLFEPFRRHAATSPCDDAESMGLAIAKRVVEAVGGTIQVESKVGQGSCFRIHLPLAPA